MNKDKILAEVQMNLGRGRAVGTGIGLFILVIDEHGNLLLRRRLEKGSLFGDDLSGKCEMIGVGMDISHFAQAETQEPDVSRYHRPILETLIQEMDEEAGLNLVGNFSLIMAPAFFSREYEYKGEERQAIDLAFSIPVPFSALEKTDKFTELMEKGELKFVPRGRLSEIEIVAPRIRFLIKQALQISILIS